MDEPSMLSPPALTRAFLLIRWFYYSERRYKIMEYLIALILVIYLINKYDDKNNDGNKK